ncbi:MAG: hypothetical protein ACI9RL_001290 [Candidatus Paceibacteria bacterium]|jgi:hypothetical protein
MKQFFFFVFLCCCITNSVVHAQEAPIRKKTIENKKPPIEYYKAISHQRDTTYLDTTLTIQKSYTFNYLRSDTFELLPFSNVGQTYNTLAIHTVSKRLKPLFAAQSHHYGYKEIEDVSYYNVPTPLTEIYFKTAFEQGQQLDAFFTINTSEQFNFSLAYKGVRSLGNYQHSLTSTRNLLITSSYHTKNNRYNARFHVAAHDILNRENGGLTANSLSLFINDDPEFSDRGRLDVNFEDADNKLKGLRFYGNHEYALIQKKDSTSTTALTIGNTVWYEDKFFEYRQATAYENYGVSYEQSGLNSKTTLEDFNIQAYARFDSTLFGNVKAFTTFTDYNYGYDTLVALDSGVIPNRIKGNLLAIGGAYEKTYKGFQLKGEGAINVSGALEGNYVNASAGYTFNTDTKAQASLRIHSAAPNFNFQLYQNDYVNYNWKTEFNNIKTQEFRFDLQSKKIANITLSYTGIDDYTYFGIETPVDPEEGTFYRPTPQQLDGRIEYLKIKAEREIRWNRFALNNTVMYQKALKESTVFNVPQIVTRQSLYYQDHLFKNALFFQTGINVKYFTSYNMNGYDPVLGEFYVQNDEAIGGFPIVDLFFNAKIQQTRIFLKWEHVNAMFTNKNQYFSAPGYPYRESLIRFGFVWDFFL